MKPIHMREPYPDSYQDAYSRTVFGMWIYLLTDFILFGAFFATYAVLHASTFGGPTAQDLFRGPFHLIQAFVMLFCAFTIGLAGVFAHRKRKNHTIALLLVTFVLGALFLGMLTVEFRDLMAKDYLWHKSAFLSAYYTIVGTFSLHIIFGLLWMILFVLFVHKHGLTPVTIRRVTCLRMFWQFLNVLWLFIFSFIYLLGAA